MLGSWGGQGEKATRCRKSRTPYLSEQLTNLHLRSPDPTDPRQRVGTPPAHGIIPSYSIRHRQMLQDPACSVRIVPIRYLVPRTTRNSERRYLNYCLCWGYGGSEGSRTLDLLNAIQSKLTLSRSDSTRSTDNPGFSQLSAAELPPRSQLSR